MSYNIRCMIQRSSKLWRRWAAVALLSSPPLFNGQTAFGFAVARGNPSTSSAVGDQSDLDNNGDDIMSNQSIMDAKSCSSNSNVYVTSYDRLEIHHFRDEPIGSTQDEARRLLQQLRPSIEGPYLAVMADEQSHGRGTSGRRWESGRGNLYLTVCIPFDSLPVMPTLLPLQIAVLVAETTIESLSQCRQENKKQKQNEEGTTIDEANVTVKWPNDVLINDKKLAGTLIETEIVDGTTWLLVGIGTNINFAPSLERSPGKHKRGTTCIRDHCSFKSDKENNKMDHRDHPGEDLQRAHAFGLDIAKRLVKWMVAPDGLIKKKERERQIIQRWKSLTEFGQVYEIRGTVEKEDTGEYLGEIVTAIDIKDDGQLVVVGQDGKERLLIADYLF